MPLTRRHFGALTGATALAVAAPSVVDPAWGATGGGAAGAGNAPAKRTATKHRHPAKHPAPKHHKTHRPSISQVEHVLRRTTYGATPTLVAEVRRIGVEAWIDEQLHPHRINDHSMDKLLTRWPNLKLKSWEIREQFGFGAWDVMYDVVDAHIARAIWSKRQLFELLVDFWSNHLNVTCPSGDVWDNRHLFDQQVIRPHALGTFNDMLLATAKAPAMLMYLGNAYSDASGTSDPNENWGRELLELHTVGVGAGYTQKEVHTSALILSGLSVGDIGEFEYRPDYHYVGPVKVLGFSSPNHSPQGENVALDYLSYLAHHPRTATHLATKLAVRFVSDTPPPGLIKEMAALYRKHHTAILPMLQHLFASKAFAESVGEKVRTPYEDFISTCRVLRVHPPRYGTNGIRGLQYLTSGVGQPPLGWAPPNGYPDVAGAWASTSTTLGKWNLHMTLGSQWYPSRTDLSYTDPTTLLPKKLPKTYRGLIVDLAKALNVPALNPTQIGALSEFLGYKPGDPLGDDPAVIRYQLGTVIALILDSSHQAER